MSKFIVYIIIYYTFSIFTQFLLLEYIIIYYMLLPVTYMYAVIGC